MSTKTPSVYLETVVVLLFYLLVIYDQLRLIWIYPIRYLRVHKTILGIYPQLQPYLVYPLRIRP